MTTLEEERGWRAGDEPVIDCHGHIGAFAGYDLSPETLLAEVQSAGIDLVLVSNIDGAAVPGKTAGLDESAANRATRDFVEEHPDRFRGLLWARPDTGSAAALTPFLEDRVQSDAWTARVFVGLKLHPEMNAFAADDPRVDPYLELCARAGLPVVVHCDGALESAGPERIAALARRHPRVPVVLYHMGFHGPHEPSIRVVEEALASDSADLYLETSQADPRAVLHAVSRVGAGRVLFGTDATYYGRGHYGRYRKLLDLLGRELDPEALGRVLFHNSAELFGVKEPELP